MFCTVLQKRLDRILPKYKESCTERHSKLAGYVIHSNCLQQSQPPITFLIGCEPVGTDCLESFAMNNQQCYLKVSSTQKSKAGSKQWSLAVLGNSFGHISLSAINLSWLLVKCTNSNTQRSNHTSTLLLSAACTAPSQSSRSLQVNPNYQG